MSLRLTNRQRQVPGGFRFTDHATGYKAPPFASFNVIVNGVRAARLANPALVKQHDLATDIGAIEAEVDYVAITDDVFFAFKTEFARGLDGLFVA